MKPLLLTTAFIAAFFLGETQGFKKVPVGTNAAFNKTYQNRTVHPLLQKSVQDDEVEKDGDKQVNKDSLRRQPQFEPDQVFPVANKTTPAPLLSVKPDVQGVDPMIAAGHNFMVITQDHKIAFFDKKAKPLLPKPGGIDTSWSSTNFFGPMIDAANANEFAFLQTAPPGVFAVCKINLGGSSATTAVLNEAYDTRVVYEPVNKRFVILSAIRNQVWHSEFANDLCKTYAVRIFAFAVSVTEDPRDGFMMWYWTQNNYRDWPRISVDKDVLTVAHNGTGAAGTPSMYVISMQDLLNGEAAPRWFSYNKGSGNITEHYLPVAKFISTAAPAFEDYVMFLQSDDKDAVLYYFKKNALMWNIKPALGHTNITLPHKVNLSWHERPVYRNGSIYFTSIRKTTEAIPNLWPSLFGFDLYRLPLKKNGNKIEFDASSTKKLQYPVTAGTISATEFGSYEVPCMSVNGRGIMLVAYGRWKQSPTSPVFPECRYFEFVPTETKHRASNVLQQGNYMPMYTPKDWTKSVPNGFIHLDGESKYIDYGTVTPDPVDSFVFWIAYAFADAALNDYKLVVGKIQAAW